MLGYSWAKMESLYRQHGIETAMHCPVSDEDEE